MLRPQDVVVALKIAALDREPWGYASLAESLGMSIATVHQSFRRLVEAELASEPRRTIVGRALREFLVHGIRYSFAPVRGRSTRGMPTGPSAPVLRGRFAQSEQTALVWPDAEGGARGESIEPLHRSVPAAARRDARFYALLAVVDALRAGTARERGVAEAVLGELLPDAGGDRPTRHANLDVVTDAAVLHATAEVKDAAPSSVELPTLAGDLVVGAGPPVAFPRRSIRIWPLGGRNVWTGKQLLAALTPPPVAPTDASALTFPDLEGLEPERREKGLLWRSDPAQGPRLDWALAVAVDGSFAADTSFWEDKGQASERHERRAIGLGSCIDILVASMFMSDHVLVRAAQRRARSLCFTLQGVRGYHVIYDWGDPLLAPPRTDRSSDEDQLTFQTPLPAELPRPKVRGIVEAFVSGLEYYFGDLDEQFSVKRAETAFDRLRSS